MADYGLKPLDKEAITLLLEFSHRLTEQRGYCSFCQGGNICLCGSCPEGEYHDQNCLVNLLDRIIWEYREQKGKPLSLVLLSLAEVEQDRQRMRELEEQLEK